MALEKPSYKVIEKNGPFEVREYDPYITSQVSIKAKNHREAASMGFNPLANYIFGGNTSKQKMAMTAPVSAQPQSEKIAMTAPVAVTGNGTYTVSFVIPREYTLDSLPIPNDSRVQFVEHPPQTFAVIIFSGAFNQRNFERNLDKLKSWMGKKGLYAEGEPVIAGYNAPFVPSFLKHNEILIQV